MSKFKVGEIAILSHTIERFKSFKGSYCLITHVLPDDFYAIDVAGLHPIDGKKGFKTAGESLRKVYEGNKVVSWDELANFWIPEWLNK